MSGNIVLRPAVLTRKTGERPGLEIWMVVLDGKEAAAVVYAELVGHVTEGDRVLVNTTAVELDLGTGGQHFVLCRLDPIGPLPPSEMCRDEGHIMKLRYTPQQLRVRAVEEESSPYHDAMHTVDHLPGTPVICLGLHSQLAPAVGGIKAANPALRVAYVMTDSGALPLAYSATVAHLRAASLLDVTVTVGQAFGGDLEAVNLYSGLVAAVVAGKADVIIAGQGPGNAGTATALGFGGVEQAMLLNAASALDGAPVAVPRLSFADPRERHRGISHHTLTVLRRLVLAEVTLTLPRLSPEQSDFVQMQLRGEGAARHTLRIRNGEPGVAYCQHAGITLRSMGRGYDSDPLFFQAAAAAGDYAASLVRR